MGRLNGSKPPAPAGTVRGLAVRGRGSAAFSGRYFGAVHRRGHRSSRADGEEFGERRLLETLRAHDHLSVPSLLQTIVAAVQQFSSGKPQDDITLVVARCKTQ